MSDLVRHPIADTEVTLRTSEGAVVRTTVERVTFADGRYADFRRRGLGGLVTQAARGSTGTAHLTVAERSFAARTGAVVGATVIGILGAIAGGLTGVALCFDGCESIPAQVTIGALLGALLGASGGASMGALFGAVIDVQQTAAQPATLIDGGP
ncbi:MAG: hypothetical protein Q8S73_28965 [Deltaproteobacteria bacterium]|nr:hypothetical protein [Myxococcales bacterium]MDP3218172.1 hypothetical protein [Deltaproteobacteria bacterium]